MRNILHVALLFASAFTSGCLAELPEPPAYPSVVDASSNVTLGKAYCGRVFRAAEERRRGSTAAMTTWFTVSGLSVIGFVPATVHLARENEKHEVDVKDVSLPILLGLTAIATGILAGTQIMSADTSTEMRNLAAEGSLKKSDEDAFATCVSAVTSGDVDVDPPKASPDSAPLVPTAAATPEPPPAAPTPPPAVPEPEPEPAPEPAPAPPPAPTPAPARLPDPAASR